MSEIFETLLSVILLSIVVMYGWYKLSNEKINFKNKKMYITYVLFVIISLINGYISNSSIKLMTYLVIWSILHNYLFRCSIKETLVTIIETQFMLILLEGIIVMFVLGILKVDYEILNSNTLLKLSPNALMVVLIYIVFLFKFPVTIKNKVVDFIDKLSSKIVVLFLILLMICINISLAIIYYENTTILIIVVEFIILAIYTIITILMLKEKNKSEQYRLEGIAQSKVLQNYLEMFDQQRIMNHENTNQLLVIQGMARNKQTDEIIDYTEVALGEKKQDNVTLLDKVKKIPLGTLQGLIYQKWLDMKSKNIEFKLVLPRRMKDIDFTKLDMKTNSDLCKVVGVILDNAIEEVTKLENKVITFELYLKDTDMYIMVMNHYEKLIENMDESGKTSKGKGHGYGLSVIKDVTKKNKRIRNEKNIIGNKFQQLVIVSDMNSNKKK